LIAYSTEGGFMRRGIVFALSISSCALAAPIGAAELKDMMGRWTWAAYKLEVSECAGGRICAKVIAGPKNVGMEIFASEFINKEGAWFGQVVSPETGATYNTRMQFTAAKTWRLDGCTASRVCLSGELVRSDERQ
jgi:uncharacterized protein (DUF2147 family)